jgi:5-methylcytosine-specific restriction endonuclease McrBC GTP-binding regulatory subunit McrB
MKISSFDPDTGEIEVEHDTKNIFDFFESKKFNFPKEIITSYVLSLATKPFVMLSGISGTGKTKIAQLFADYMCQNCTEAERDKRIAFVPVRPDWLDNRGILGYYNILEQAYSSTPILRLLIEADKKENQNKPYFIILDEMNLAKVEYYFADFLSIMESRTIGNENGKKLHLHDGKKEKNDDKGIVEDADGTVIPRMIHIPDNVYFTGTVNVDESTYMFSPKVLDRANVIEFNEVNLLPSSQGITSQFRFKQDDNGDYADIEKINSIFNNENRRVFCHSQDFIDCLAKNEIDDVHNILKNKNLHFGYRVANEFARFINLSDELVGKDHRNEAIDIQILQKILPKFHGTKVKLNETLTALKTHCDEKNYTRSSAKLKTMLKQLEEGYTSFIQ